MHFFLHQPKTAGTSIKWALARQYPEAKRAHGHWPEIIALSDFSVYEFVCGHIDHCLAQALFPKDTLTVTILREPVERFVSVFNYIAATPDHRMHRRIKEKGGTIEGFLADNRLRDHVCNVQARMIGFDYPVEDVLRELRNSAMSLEQARQQIAERRLQYVGYEDNILAAARKRIEAYGACGVYEQLLPSVQWMFKALGKPEPAALPEANISRKGLLSVSTLSEEDKQRILAANRLDAALYDYARELFAKRNIRKAISPLVQNKDKTLLDLIDSAMVLGCEGYKDPASWWKLYGERETIAKTPGLSRTLAQLRLLSMKKPFDEGGSLFFITGSFKSGTTWLSLMLRSHPHLFCCVEEIHSFSAEVTELFHGEKLERRSTGAGYDRWQIVRKLKKLSLYAMMLSQCDKPWVRRFGGKGPVTDLEALIEEYPHVRIPVIIRDGRDIATSAAFFYKSYAQDNSAFTDEGMMRFREHFVRVWAENFRNIYSKYRELAARYPANIAIYRYEDFLADPYAALIKTLTFLEVSANTEIVKYCVEKNNFKTLSEGREAGEEDKASFFRKGIYGDWANYFTPEQNAIFCDIAGDTLEAFGYVQGFPLAQGQIAQQG